jgi:cytochrome b
MSLQLVFAIVILLAIIGLVGWFFVEKKAISTMHTKTVSALEEAISKNKGQINFRNHYLDKYHFLQYNLLVALVIQPEIEL